MPSPTGRTAARAAVRSRVADGCCDYGCDDCSDYGDAYVHYDDDDGDAHRGALACPAALLELSLQAARSTLALPQLHPRFQS